MQQVQVVLTFDSEQSAAEFFAQRAESQVRSSSPVLSTSVAALGPMNGSVDHALGMLNDDRYSLRSTATVVEDSGFSNATNLYAALGNAGVRFITRRRNSDNAEMIGLASRN